MKHTLLVFSFLFVFLMLLNGQDEPVLVFEPSTVEKNYTGDISNSGLDIELHTLVKNLSDDTLYLRWERVIVNQPIEWWTQVCDLNFCYDPPVSTNIDLEKGINEPVVLLPKDSFDLIFHVLPNGREGIGEFELPFSMVEDKEEIISKVKFIARVGTTTSSNDLFSEAKRITVFPNPAVDYFQLSSSKNINAVAVYSIIGKKVKSFNTVFDGKKYDIADLPNGLYLVSLMNDKEGVLRTLRLSKRTFRP